MLTEAWRRAGQPTVFVQVPALRTTMERVMALARPRDAAPVIRPWHAYPSRWWPHLSEKRFYRAVRRNAGELRRQLDRCVDFANAAAIVVSPVWTPWLDTLPFRHVVYDCIDDVAVHMPRPALAPLYRKWENELIERASGAAATAQPLLEGLRARRPDLPTATIRNGVDAELFARVANSSPRPRDLPPASRRPIVGFVGALYEWIDWDLIAAVGRALPEFDFVFVGPVGRRGSAIRPPAASNLRFLGARPYEAVPTYVRAFDVCWVPFDQSRVSRMANPVKIYEYLALGKPVVSTPVADTDSFAEHVRVGRDAGEIAGHLRAAVGEADGQGAERVRFARANSWDARAAEYVSFVAALRG
jgi:glycosyltransferase involved in cell wall biosynthesis